MADAAYVFEEQAGCQAEQGQPYLLYQGCSENTACVTLCQAIWETQGKGSCLCMAPRSLLLSWKEEDDTQLTG